MVIQAQLRDRRRSGDQRRPMQLLASGKSAHGALTDVVIHDLSTGGLLLETDADLTTGETIEVVLPLTGAHDANIVWANGAYFGCQFRRPVPPASVSAALLRAAPVRERGRAPLEFGEKLAALRREKDWSMDALADKLGVSRQAVWYWESGQRLPRADHFKRIAEIFEVPEAQLLPAAIPFAERDATLIDELRRRVAENNGVPESAVRIIVEF
jgi:transcriptional regulator with XRE-family HTH domain